MRLGFVTNLANAEIVAGATGNPGNPRRPIYSTPSTKDNIIACATIAIAVLGFATFLYFYLEPLFKARRDAKAEKQRRMLLKPISTNDRKQFGLDESPPPYNSRSQGHEPSLPRKVVLKDSVTAKRAARVSIPIEPSPIPPRPSPPRDGPKSILFSDLNASRDEFFTSSPPRDSSDALASLAPNRSESFSFTFVISNSDDSISSKIPVLSQDCSPPQAQSSTSPPRDAFSPPPPGGSTFPPRSSSLRNDIFTNSHYSVNSALDTSKAPPVPREENPRGEAPVYADVVFPRYFRDSVKPYGKAQASRWAAEEYENVPTITISDPGKADSDSCTKIESLHVPDTVLSRASTYTRGLVGSSTPKSAKLAGTELQFEIVKHQ